MTPVTCGVIWGTTIMGKEVANKPLRMCPDDALIMEPASHSQVGWGFFFQGPKVGKSLP